MSDKRRKLTEQQVEQIRAAKQSINSLSKEYGVTRRAIWKIVNGYTWKK